MHDANLLRRQAWAGLDFLVRSAEFEYNQSAQMDKHEYRQRLDRQLMQNKWE